MRLLAVVTSATLLALAGVHGGVATLDHHDGPLQVGGDDGILCIPTSADGHYTFGLDAARNTTDEALRVDAVALVGARNVAMVGPGYLSPIDETGAIGAMPGWPPEGGSATFDRKRVMPLTLAPGHTENLVLHLVATTPAEFDAIEVTYTASGAARRERNSTRLEIRDSCLSR